MAQNKTTAKILSWVAATGRFLLRPFTMMWPMMVTMCLYYALAKLLLHGGCIEMKAALPELYVITLLLSTLKGRWRTVTSAIVMAVITLLTAIEVFIYSHFKLTLANEVFQLMLESSTDETSQFLSSFVYRWNTLLHVAIPLLCAVVAFMLRRWSKSEKFNKRIAASDAGKVKKIKIGGLVACMVYLVYSGWVPQVINHLYVMGSENVSDFEKRYMTATENGGNGANTSLSRLFLGIKLYSLTSQQCDEVLETARHTRVDGCDFTSPNIMLFIGESGIKKHYQIYGYDHATTPRQQEELDKGNLIVMTDAMTMATQTSEVMKNMLSMHSIEQPDTWTSAPMMPQIMKMSGYHVSFVTNQYAKVSNSVWNSTGGFFLRDDRVGKLLLDYITPTTHKRDESLLDELDQAIPAGSKHNLTMFHVRGQHVAYADGYPPERQHFTPKDYSNRKELDNEQRQVVAHYDNCTLYQDSICGVLFDRFADKDMVIIFVSDHGENAYDDGKTLGRVHNDYSPAMVNSQYRIPMWVWCSPKYRELHPDMVERFHKAAQLPFQIDDIPHMILEMAGVKCPYLDTTRSLISPSYNTHRPRLAIERGKK